MSIFITLILLISSGYVLLLSYIALSPTELQRAIVLPIVVMAIFLVLYRPISKSWRAVISKWGKLFLLFWGTAFVQLLVLSSGGLQSPFLILIYLFMMAISFIFSFSLAVVFLIVSLTVIFANLSFYTNIFAYLMKDPTFTILHIVSLIPIVPLAYLISRQYHLRDILFSTLNSKIKTDEAILAHLQELIIVTDAKLTILSVNDAVEQAFQKSRTEFIGNQFFNLILLRDENGKLATKETFFPDGDTSKTPNNITPPFILQLTSLPHKEVSIQVQSTKGIANAATQISFILSQSAQLSTAKNTLANSLEKTRTKYDALNEDMRSEILKTRNTTLISQSLLLREIENDMRQAQMLHQYPTIGIISSIDAANLIKLAVDEKKDFAKSFNVELDFSIIDFGEKDIAPLTVKNYPVKPEQLTGPFFTVKTDIRRFELLVKKLIDIGIFLASSQTKPNVSVSVKRVEKDSLQVVVSANSEILAKDEITDLFLPYYGKLYDKTPLHLGSGLEGYLVNAVCNALLYVVKSEFQPSPNPHITFSITVPKNLSPKQ